MTLFIPPLTSLCYYSTKSPYNAHIPVGGIDEDYSIMPFALTIGEQRHAHDICTEVFTKGSLGQTLPRIPYPPSSTLQHGPLPATQPAKEMSKRTGAHAPDISNSLRHTIERFTTVSRVLYGV